MEVKKTTQHIQKNRKFTAIAWIMAILIFLISIPVNLLVDYFDIHWDLTPNQLYTLTDTTTDYLNSVKDKTVNMYFLMDMDKVKDDKDSLALYNALTQYAEFDCIQFKDFEADDEPELIKELNPDGFYNLTEGDFIFECEGVVKRIPASLMYKYNYSQDETTGETSVNSAYFCGENYLTGAIKTVVTGETPAVYFLTGHDETPLSDYSTLQANLANYNYTAKSLNLSETKKVPEDAKIILVPGPKKDISDEEREMLNTYLDEGGNINFMMTPNESNIRYKNIERILADYCLGMNYDRVTESDNSRQAVGNPDILMVNLSAAKQDSESYPDLTSGLMEESQYIPYMPASRSFYEIYNANYTTLVMDTLITTNETAIGEVYGGTDEDPDPTQNTSLALARYAMDRTRNDSKVLVMGSADFINDENLQSDYYIVPVYLFLSTITWMYNSDVDMKIADREKTYDYMEFDDRSAANRTLYIFIAMPILIAAIGVGVWVRRKNS